MQDKQSDHAVLKSRIDMVRDDIQYLKTRIAEVKGRKPPAKSRAVNGNSKGRPKNLETLQAELQADEAMRAYLHAEWIKLRGEAVYIGLFAELEKSGVIPAPAKPIKPKRGRPSKHVVGPLIRFWVYLIMAREANQGRKSTVRQAGAEAEKIIRERYKKTFVFREQDYNNEKRRTKKIRRPLKTRAK